MEFLFVLCKAIHVGAIHVGSKEPTCKAIHVGSFCIM